MNGTITMDITQDRQVILNARRNEPYAHKRMRFNLSQFGDIHAFISHYLEAINDEALNWDMYKDG